MTDKEMNATLDAFIKRKTEERTKTADKPNGPATETPYVFKPQENLPLIRAVLEEFAAAGKASVSFLQQRFFKGYRAAAAIMDYLKEMNYIGTNPDGRLTVLISDEEIFNISPEKSYWDD